MKNFLKILGLVLACLFLGYIGWIAISYWGNKAEDEIYVVPQDFEGAVIVLFNQEEGKSVKYDNEGNRVYEIPDSGILKTKFKFQEGFREIKYQRDNGKTIRYLLPSDKVWRDTINQNGGQDSTYVYGARHAGNFWFIVGKPKDIEYRTKIMREKWQPYSEKKVLREGQSSGNIKNNELFGE